MMIPVGLCNKSWLALESLKWGFGMWLVGGVVAKGVFERGVPEPVR
jgi:hypothetical protein